MCQTQDMFNCNNKESEGRVSDSVENDEARGVITRVLTRVTCDKWARARVRQYTLRSVDGGHINQKTGYIH